MTADGKAKVVDRNNPSPSPEKQPPPFQAPAALRRRSTADSSLGRTGMRASAAGRSRDSRTWEFWCDSDARNSLIERADQEASGSAAEAIGLIRAKSNSRRRNALKPNPGKMNSPAAAVLHAKGAEPSMMHKAKLKRASTSPTTATGSVAGNKGDCGVDEEDFEHLNSESDKENRSPHKGGGAGSRPRGVRRTYQPSGGARGALGENKSDQVGAGRPPPPRRRATDAGPTTPPARVDAEVSAFMAGVDGSAASMPEELDCVQSLLSLSQGNWE
jgi:hypothetical protein